MDEAIRMVCAEHLHRCLWLPQNSTHDRLRVTYSTTSNIKDDALPAILFCGPMFGSRWNSLFIDRLAIETGVRVICVDRPGMGGSTPVPLSIRISVWLETVPALMKAVNVKHVSLVSHSAGTHYAANTLFYLPEILDPRAPYMAFIAPWVHNDHSQATLMNLLAKIPDSWFNSWNQVNRFINTRIAPTVSWSGGISSSVVNLFQAEPGSSDSGETSVGEKYGVSEEVGKHIEKLQSKYFLAEDTTAANDEALLCLKKGGTGNWGACEDYKEYVGSLAKRERERRSSDQNRSKLQVEVYFAESDIMIGKGGQEYFEQCWQQDGVADAIDFEATELPGINHETAIMDLKKGGLKPAFEHVARLKGR